VVRGAARQLRGDDRRASLGVCAAERKLGRALQLGDGVARQGRGPGARGCRRNRRSRLLRRGAPWAVGVPAEISAPTPILQKCDQWHKISEASFRHIRACERNPTAAPAPIAGHPTYVSSRPRRAAACSASNGSPMGAGPSTAARSAGAMRGSACRRRWSRPRSWPRPSPRKRAAPPARSPSPGAESARAPPAAAASGLERRRRGIPRHPLPVRDSERRARAPTPGPRSGPGTGSAPRGGRRPRTGR
jgi:hypothetical protein